MSPGEKSEVGVLETKKVGFAKDWFAERGVLDLVHPVEAIRVVKDLGPREVLFIRVLLTLGRVTSLLIPLGPMELLHRTCIPVVVLVLKMLETIPWTKERVLRVLPEAVARLALTV